MLQPSLVDPQTSFAGKNVIITGANTGLGLEAASKFVALDASLVILAVRDLDKGNAAKSLIEERTENKDRIQVWHLDLNSYESIHEFAKQASALSHIDVAILNAGVFMVEYQKSKYGWEQTFQVNVLSTTLLALLLLPKMKDTAKNGSQPVLEFVASRRYEKISLSEYQKYSENLLQLFNNEDTYKSSQQYQMSKLLILCVMKELANIVRSLSTTQEAPTVVVTAICPGFCKSDLSRGHAGLLAATIRTILNTLILRTTEEGSRSLVSGVVSGSETHGLLWADDQPMLLRGLLSETDGETLFKKVWTDIIEALKKDNDDISKLLIDLNR